MKKFFTFTLILMLLLTQPVLASEQTQTETVQYEYFDDGSYTLTTIDTVSDNSLISLLSTTTTTTKSKTTTYYNSSGDALWYVKVTGTFTYGNGSATCKSSSVTAASYVSTWKIYSKSASKSGNTATGKATAKLYQNIFVIQTLTKSVTLTCSSTGVFS